MPWVRAELWVRAALWWDDGPETPAPTPPWRTLHIPAESRIQREKAA